MNETQKELDELNELIALGRAEVAMLEEEIGNIDEANRHIADVLPKGSVVTAGIANIAPKKREYAVLRAAYLTAEIKKIEPKLKALKENRDWEIRTGNAV